MKKFGTFLLWLLIIVIIAAIVFGGYIFFKDKREIDKKIGELENKISEVSSKNDENKDEIANQLESINEKISNNSGNNQNKSNNVVPDSSLIRITINKELIKEAKSEEPGADKYYAKYFELGKVEKGDTVDIYVWAQFGKSSSNNTIDSGTSLPVKITFSASDYTLKTSHFPPDDTDYKTYFPDIADALSKLEAQDKETLFGQTYFE